MTLSGASEHKTAAIIVTYHTGRPLKDCLHALAATAGIDQIMIVDNGNPPDMVDWLVRFAKKTPTAKLIKQAHNIGFGSGVNIGARAAETGSLLVINPDCVMRPDALEALHLAAKDKRSPVMIGGRIYDINGEAQRGPRRSELTKRRLLSKLFGGRGINLPLQPQPAGPVGVDVTSGAFFLIDKSGFDQLGGFDTDYFLHVEDIDLCKRVHLAGGEVIYQPDAGALHYGASSDVSMLFVERHKAAGFARYLRKFSNGVLGRIGAELIIPLVFVALTLRAWLAGRR
ncbi:MAG: glycosyltransferase family 2 protein [Hyphomonadaceae bacterium]